ncbi:SEC10/PgrA surface exclusion domain-containing protein [Streptococcus dysgalactiae subsp. equisimilis]|uniref:SEC10/PgrA surface exclusion domain-containing protein n=1 Tax=Streptococcus dysgalactiae TaxID=1334 RepID=UPI000A114EBB|nr:SEC10/PgrA surface exclusion domain-containing protein [Streptococcus dysgalactiae]MCY7196362.1 SEC10/PgrA surface exclusion domain-containing protein [Streptococcus dysgalactiae]MCY7199495.1 SEC10/PgrA surface exclusion domain-containing protein [Streptococcus dysgalactiae]MCY7206376.1 SEC10/PgrA surface exclusion domain-containing protein [Streptococcus dysgalactiae]MCY7214903.1 SEC10/PgrA surface exclusion domain-containing protein [Streptococcus dysgalactiae]MQA59673.1 SEC10/PgrA surfac
MKSNTKKMVTSAALVAALVGTGAKAHADTVIPVNTTGDVAAANENATLETQVKDQEVVVNNLTEKVQEAKVADDMAEKAVEQAKANEANAADVETQKVEVDKQLATAENDVKVANEEVATETKDVEKAQAENKKAQDALKVAENEAAKASTEVKQPSTVELDNDFAEALGHKGQSDYSEDLNMMGGDNNFTFVTNPGDEQTVDVDNLTDDQLTDLSNYASSLINQVRDQARKAGVNVTVGNTFVTKGAVQFAKDVAQNYRKDNWNTFEKSHDVAAIDNAARANGLQANGGYENAGVGQLSSYRTHTFTMTELKKHVYDAIEQMISHDSQSNWKHTESLVGTGLSGEYLGISISRVGDVVTVHVLQVPKSRIQNPSKFDTTKLLNPYQGEVNPKAKEVLKQLESARTLAANKAQALATQQSKLQAAKSHVAELTNKVVQLKEQQAQLGNVQSGDLSALVTSAVERKAQTARNLADMQAALDSATAKLNNLKAALAKVPAKPEEPTPSIPNVPEAPAKPTMPSTPEKPTATEVSKSSTERTELPRHQEKPSRFNQSVTPSSTVRSITAKLINSNQQSMTYQAKLPETKDSADKGAIIGFLTLGLALIPFVGNRFKSSRN